MEPLDLLRALLDPRRLALVGLLAARPRSAAALAAETGQREREVLAGLAPFVQGGIVARDGDAYRLVIDALRTVAAQLAQPPPAADRVLWGMTAEEQAVLARFFRGGRLVELPAARGKRRVVLERIALDFEPGVRYQEADVNARLCGYHDDYAALRRYLVDEGLLDRAGGQYWRSGGRVD